MSVNDWRKKLRSASFRGAKFFMDSSEFDGGRRVQLNEFPLRDVPYPDDQGRKARGYRLNAYCITPLPGSADAQAGLTYMDLRDKLITALELGGPGTLVHPYLTIKGQVVPGLFTMSETWEKGGYASFSLSFTEAGALLNPVAAVATQNVTQTAATALQTALNDGFTKKFSVLDEAKWISDAAVKKLGQVTQAMNDASQYLTVPSAITNLVSASTAFSSGLTGLISAPSALAASMLGIVNLVPSLVDQPLDALKLYKHGLFSFGAGDTPDTGDSAGELQDEANRKAVNTYVIGSAIAGYATVTSQIPATSSVSFPAAAAPQAVTGIQGYDTRDATDQALQDLLDAAEALLQFLDDDSYAAMKDLCAAVAQDLNARAAALPTLVTWTPPATLPALVVAQMRYGDATRADEIVARNDVVNPSFVQGGVALELLSV